MTAHDSGASPVPTDPFGPEAARRPHEYLKSIRSDHPVCPLDDDHTFLITSYEELTDVIRQPTVFSNASAAKGAAMLKAGLLSTDPAVLALGSQFIVTEPTLQRADPPEHTRGRRAVSRWFNAKRVLQEWDPIVRSVTTELLDGVPVGVPIDFMADIAIPLPIRVIARVLGVDDDRHGDLKQWSDANVSHAGRRLSTGEAIAQAEANLEMQNYFRNELADRRRHPRNDLMSHLAALADDSGDDSDEQPRDRLSVTESLDIVVQLVVAGNETTTQFLGDLATLLAENPDQLERVRADRALIPNLIDEALRLSSPVLGLFRAATTDTELDGVLIPAGALVTPLFAAANRDPAVFPEPEEFRIDRANAGDHVAFGQGIHYCIGATLAKAEARACLEQILDRYDSIELLPAHEDDDHGTIMMRGRKRMPVILTPGRNDR